VRLEIFNAVNRLREKASRSSMSLCSCASGQGTWNHILWLGGRSEDRNGIFRDAVAQSSPSRAAPVGKRLCASVVSGFISGRGNYCSATWASLRYSLRVSRLH